MNLPPVQIINNFPAPPSEFWGVVDALGSALGGLAVILSAAARYYTARTVRQNSKGIALQSAALAQSAQAAELQIFESLFRNVRELDREYLHAGFSKSPDPDRDLAWATCLFQHIRVLRFSGKPWGSPEDLIPGILQHLYR
jgi:hypothetical protein